MYRKKEIGIWGEKIVCNYLEKNVYKIIEKNFRCKQGEIDIIAWDNTKKQLVFVEVKTRTNLNYGTPAEAVDERKKSHILKSSKYYLYVKNMEECSIRFDVVEVVARNNKVWINHLKDVDMCAK